MESVDILSDDITDVKILYDDGLICSELRHLPDTPKLAGKKFPENVSNT